MINYFRGPSLLEAREKAFIILIKEIFCLSNRKNAYLLHLLGIEGEIIYKALERTVFRSIGSYNSKKSIH